MTDDKAKKPAPKSSGTRKPAPEPTKLGLRVKKPVPTPPKRRAPAKTQTTAPEPTKKTPKAIAWGIILVLVFAALIIALATIAYSSGKSDSKTTSDKSTKIADANGTVKVLPVVGSKGEVAPVNTTQDVRTPASFHPFSQDNKFVLTWGQLVDAVNAAHATSYRDAINSRKKATGFNWADIEKWANDPQLSGVYPLTIQVFGGGFSDAQARNIAAELVGPKLAARLSIVRHPSGVLINTRSVGDNRVGDFLDLRSMVRVSLSPVVYDRKGNVRGVSRNSGIFADCLNIWRLGKVVKHHAQTPGKTHKKHKKHPHHPHPHHPLAHKKAWKDPYARGNALHGGGPNATKGPGDKTSRPKKPPNTPRPNPTTPAPSPSPTPGATSTPTPDPKPTPTPEATGTAGGTVTPPGM